MFFDVVSNNGVPIYAQIERHIKFAIARRTLRPGQLLPSVRQISLQLAVNPNTVTRAINQLQDEGILNSLRGRGMVVANDALAPCRKYRQSILAERIEAVLLEARQAGLDSAAIEALVSKKLKAMPGPIEEPEIPINPKADAD